MHYTVGCTGSRTNKATIRVVCASITPPNKISFLPCSVDSAFLLCNTFLKRHEHPQSLTPPLCYRLGKQQCSTASAARVGACSSRPCGSARCTSQSSSSAGSLIESSLHYSAVNFNELCRTPTYPRLLPLFF